MALGSLSCNDWYVISIFMISRLFELQFWPMNSCWNKNWIIFTMTLVSTYFGSRIKIRVFRPTQDWFQVKFGQTWSKLSKLSMKLGFDVKLWKILFSEGFDLNFTQYASIIWHKNKIFIYFYYLFYYLIISTLIKK